MGDGTGLGGDGRMGMDGWMEGLWGSDGMIASGGPGGMGGGARADFPCSPGLEGVDR